MLISTFINLLILLAITGYSYLFKKIIFKEKIIIENIDLLYGIFFLSLIAILGNFIMPTKYISLLIFVSGIITFIFQFIKKRIKINFFIHIFILFILTFISYRNGNNVDSPMYHMQIIKWIQNEKVVFGLANLEIRYGINSMWFNFLALFSFKYGSFNTNYIINFIPFSILLSEIFLSKKRFVSFSYLLIFSIASFLIFYSYLHPYMNGIILNHLRNPELDTVAMIFFFLTFYLFLIFLEKKDINSLRLIALSSSMTIFTKISYMGVILFFLVSIYIFYRKDIKKIFSDYLNLSIIFTGTLWLVKNFITSGCLIFPLSKTCFNTSWSSNPEEINIYAKIVKSYARDTRERARYHDFDHTIDSFSWFKPWFHDYFLNNSLLLICMFIIIISTLLIVINQLFFKKNKDFEKNKNIYSLIFFILIINLLLWFQAPEIRFGWGTLISIPCFLFIVFYHHSLLSKILDKRGLKIIFLTLICFLVFDNKKGFQFSNLIVQNQKNFNYSKIKKFAKFNQIDFFYTQNWQCFDFKEVCVNIRKKKYNPKKLNGYLFFLTK